MKNNPQLFIVCGASSGFGGAVTTRLINEGHRVVAIARDKKRFKELSLKNPDNLSVVEGDLTDFSTLEKAGNKVQNEYLHGIFVNSGGPPAKKITETTTEDWDNAYKNLLRWKVEFIRLLLPKFLKQGYGRILFLESSSVKQPIQNLVLSTSLRSAVVGFAKTLSEEIAYKGITVNVLAPGFHNTQALQRLIEKKVKSENIDRESVLKSFAGQTKVGFLGDPHKLASLAGWLLSEESGYITGQTISVDGGMVKGIFG